MLWPGDTRPLYIRALEKLARERAQAVRLVKLEAQRECHNENTRRYRFLRVGRIKAKRMIELCAKIRRLAGELECQKS